MGINLLDSKIITKSFSVTPTVFGSTSAGVGTYTYNFGKCYLIGDLVSFYIRMLWTAHTGTGNLRVNPGFNIPPQSMFLFNIQADNLTFSGQLSAYADSTDPMVIVPVTFASGGSSTSLPMDSAATLVISGTYTRKL